MYYLCTDVNIVKSGDTRRGGQRDADRALAQLAAVTEEERGGGFTGLAHNSCQSTLHRSQWKFIFPIGYISFRIRLDSMLKIIWNYINPNGFAVYLRGQIQRKTWCLGLYAGDDYNLTLCPFHSLLQHIYHGQSRP
jgi:hypothetical protein